MEGRGATPTTKTTCTTPEGQETPRTQKVHVGAIESFLGWGSLTFVILLGLLDLRVPPDSSVPEVLSTRVSPFLSSVFHSGVSNSGTSGEACSGATGTSSVMGVSAPPRVW